jgi:hypothetical protein
MVGLCCRWSKSLAAVSVFFFKVVAATTKCSHIVRVDESFLLHSVRTLAAGNGGTTGDDVVAELRITVLRPHRLGVDTDDDNNNAEHEMDKIMENTVSRDERNSWARERMLVAETSPASSPSPLDASPSESAADGDTAVVPPLDALLRAVLTEAGIRPRDIDHDGMKMRADKLRSHARNLLNKGATLPPACSTPLFDDADLNSMLASHRVKSLELKVAALEDLSATKADFAAALATTQEHARNAIAALEDQSATKDELGAAFADAHEHARIAIAALVDQSATKGELAALAATQVAPAHGLSAAKTDLAALIAVQQQDLSAMRTQLAALTALVQERPAAPPPPLPPFGLAPGKAAALSACLAVPHGLFLVGVPAAVGNRLGKHNCPTEVIFIAFGNLDQGVGPIAQPGGNVQVCPIGLTEQSTVAAIRGHLKATSPALVGILVPSHCELVRADPVAVPEGRSGAEAQGEDEVIYVIEKTGANMWTMSCFLLAAVSHWRVKP